MRRQHLVALDDPVVVCGIQGAGDPALVPLSIRADLPLVPDEFGSGGEGEEWEEDGGELHGGGVFKLGWVWGLVGGALLWGLVVCFRYRSVWVW
jgi:hypothetical protein